MKKCCHCKELKDESEFYKASRKYGTLQNNCKICAKKKVIEWRKNNIRSEYKRRHIFIPGEPLIILPESNMELGR